MQQLLFDKLEWDTLLSPHLRISWVQFIFELPAVSHIVLFLDIDVRIYKEIRLLGFANASTIWYATTSFLRTTYTNEVIRVYFFNLYN